MLRTLQHGTRQGEGQGAVGFHNFNLGIFNLRVSNPIKFTVDVCLTRCRISMCQGLGRMNVWDDENTMKCWKSTVWDVHSDLVSGSLSRTAAVGPPLRASDTHTHKQTHTHTHLNTHTHTHNTSHTNTCNERMLQNSSNHTCN